VLLYMLTTLCVPVATITTRGPQSLVRRAASRLRPRGRSRPIACHFAEERHAQRLRVLSASESLLFSSGFGAQYPGAKCQRGARIWSVWPSLGSLLRHTPASPSRHTCTHVLEPEGAFSGIPHSCPTRGTSRRRALVRTRWREPSQAYPSHAQRVARVDAARLCGHAGGGLLRHTPATPYTTSPRYTCSTQPCVHVHGTGQGAFSSTGHSSMRESVYSQLE